jgi:hypothetical protein
MGMTNRRPPMCVRCGHPATRERRRPTHRLLSLVFPVHYYSCSDSCGWTGLLPTPSPALKHRLAVIAVIFLLGIIWIR